METTIKCSSYTDSFPTENCRVKVALKKDGWKNNDGIKTQTYTNAIYEYGFVSIDGGINFYLGVNFLYHKLKRNKLK